MGLPRHISHDSASSAELEQSNGIPLIDFSRTPSPSPYRSRASRSATQSEDEDLDADIPLSLRPLVAAKAEPKRWWHRGGLGAFLFGTWAGYQIYVGFLVLYMSIVTYVLVLLNRFILWSKYISKYRCKGLLTSTSRSVQVSLPCDCHLDAAYRNSFLAPDLRKLDKSTCESI